MDYGYDDDPVGETVSRVAGMFVIWLRSCEEARQQGINSNATLQSNLIITLNLAGFKRPYIALS